MACWRGTAGLRWHHGAGLLARRFLPDLTEGVNGGEFGISTVIPAQAGIHKNRYGLL
jgi:hypothetical protein